ncbi:MAG: DUF2330 domain-containing protein [Armatimonadetes bacterium]|nr:DUF2330 domain-containing protein [Armatimonadota bacterium]
MATAIAKPCAVIDPRMSITSEGTVIVYDPNTKTESFIRQIEFAGPAQSFGFLVPTPSLPTFRSLSADLIEKFKFAMEPPVVQEIRVQWVFSFGFWVTDAKSPGPQDAGVTAYPAADRARYEEFGRTKVGPYEVAVVKAKDPVALGEWAKKNGFNVPSNVSYWLGPYIEKGYYLSCFRFSSAESNYRSTTVEIKFETDKPFYPYREPKVLAGGRRAFERDLKVYFVAPQPVRALQGNTRWAAKSTQVESLRHDAISTLTSEGVNVDGKWFLTAFEDKTAVRPDVDLTFELDPGISPLYKKPYHELKYKWKAFPGGWLLVAGGGIIAAALMVFLKARPKAPKPSMDFVED